MAIDYNLLESIIGKDPLYNLYKERGLFDAGNILPYSADARWEGDPVGLEKKKSSTHGYTYPYHTDTRLFVDDLNKFKKPQAPLYNAPGMTSRLDENMADFPVSDIMGRAVGVDKFGNTQYAPKSYMEDYVERYGPNPGTYSPTGLWEGRSYSPIWNAPTITEKNKQIAETIGHEARHQLLAKHPQFEEGIPESLLTNLDKTSTDEHELLTRMLDFQAYNDPTIYDNIYGDMHGNLPRHLGSPIADAFYDQGTAFTDFMLSPKDEISTEVSESIMKEPVEPVGIETISPRKNWFKRLLDSTLMGRIGNQFAYRPAPIGGAGGYTAAQLDSMNARGGWYSEPAREKRRTINRVKNMMARKAAGKSYSQKNLANLSAQISGGRDPSQGNTVTGHGKSGMGRDPRDRMEYGGLATMFERRR